MFLAATALTEFWDKGREILFLGPWCARHDRRAEWEGLRCRVLPCLWEDRNRYAEAWGYCETLSDDLLRQIGDYLNGCFGTSHSLRYWRILFGYWLGTHVQQLYDRFLTVLEALKNFPFARTLCLAPDCFQTPGDALHYMRMSSSDLFNLQLFSQVFLKFNPSFPVKSCSSRERESPSWRPPAGFFMDFKRSLRKVMAGALHRLPRWMNPDRAGEVLTWDLCLKVAEEWRFMKASGFVAAPFVDPPAPPETWLPRWDGARKGLAGLRGGDEFSRFLIECLPVYFPARYLEGFGDPNENLFDKLDRRPRVVLSGGAWEYNERFKRLAAECAEGGSLLCSIQHGGGYGFLKYNPSETHERAISDRFYSWGWAGSVPGSNVKDLPHPVTSRPMGASCKSKEILFVYQGQYRYTPGLNEWDRYEKYFEGHARFIAALPKTLLGLLRVRADMRNNEWGHWEKLSARFPGLGLDRQQRRFERSLCRAGLFVTDYISTPFLQALAAGVPTVLFWDPTYIDIRPEARPVIESLRGGGILHDSPESAARHVAAIAMDPRKWWASAPVVEARRPFEERFLLRDARWAERWSEEFLRI